MKRTDAQWWPLEGRAPKPGRLLAIVRTGTGPYITRLAAEHSKLSVAHTHRPNLALVADDGTLVSPFGDLIDTQGVWWLDLTETMILDAPREVPAIIPTIAEDDDLEDRIRVKLRSYPIAYDGQEQAMAKDVMGILRGQS